MHELIVLLVLTTLAGLAMPTGAVLARLEKLRPDWLETELRHGIIAFGGGVLLSAVALVLVPEGSALLGPLAVSLSFAGGGLAFMGLDMWLERSGSQAAQLVAMLADFVPEAMALGAAFALGERAGPLLALLIALQNLPEGFNAYRELVSSSTGRGGRIIASFTAMALLGPAAGLGGYFILASRPALLGVIVLVASAGILYLTFQDIAPQARLERRWAPPLGAVAGFLFGLLGQMLIAPGVAGG